MRDSGNAVLYRHRKAIWILPIALTLFGLLSIASITSKGSFDSQINLYSTTGRQAVAFGLGFVFMLLMSAVSLEFWRKFSSLFWILAVIATAATLIPGVGVERGGSRSWIPLGPFMFQPLEMLSLFAPMHLAKCLSESNSKTGEVFVRITLVITGVSVLPVYFQNDFGGTLLIGVLCMAVHVENRGWKWPLLASPIFGGGIYLLIILTGYRARRLTAFLDTWSDPSGSGFQIIQGLIAFANGGISGVGIGKGLQKNYLPAAHTDYIFPAIGEEYGIIGTLGILVVFCFWFLVIWGLYRRQQDTFKATLTWGLAASVALPLFINLGGVMNLIPLTGIPLPFISYGGSSMLFMWCKIGVLARIARELSVT